jgi:hypothetical protein
MRLLTARPKEMLSSWKNHVKSLAILGGKIAVQGEVE